MSGVPCVTGGVTEKYLLIFGLLSLCSCLKGAFGVLRFSCPFLSLLVVFCLDYLFSSPRPRFQGDQCLDRAQVWEWFRFRRTKCQVNVRWSIARKKNLLKGNQSSMGRKALRHQKKLFIPHSKKMKKIILPPRAAIAALLLD